MALPFDYGLRRTKLGVVNLQLGAQAISSGQFGARRACCLLHWLLLLVWSAGFLGREDPGLNFTTGVFFSITAGPITKLFVWGEDSGEHVLRETTRFM